jgi:hypothetical protein
MPADSPCFAMVHLAAGCFWGLELAFQRLPGVVATAAGYTHGGTRGEGGERRAPTYSEVCSGRTGYVEAVEVLFDEGVVSFEKILEVRAGGGRGQGELPFKAPCASFIRSVHPQLASRDTKLTCCPVVSYIFTETSLCPLQLIPHLFFFR